VLSRIGSGAGERLDLQRGVRHVPRVTRSYAAQRWEPPEARSCCVEVRLTLEGTTFELACQRFASDWGERAQRGITYRGVFQETVDALVCRAERARVVDILYDHDGIGDYVRNDRHTEPCAELFRFHRMDGGLVCPVRYESFEGAILRLGVAPPRVLFEDAW
jgi:hypothetical protein